MGKRAHVHGDDASYEYIAKKFKILERKLEHARRKRKVPDNHRNRSSSSSVSYKSSCSDCNPGESRGGATRGLVRCASARRGTRSPAATSSSTSTSSSDSSPTRPQDATQIEDAPTYEDVPGPSTSYAENPSPPPPPPPVTAEDPEAPPLPLATQPVSHLDEEVLKILGEDPSQKKSFGKDIQTDLAVRLQHIATSGLSKEVRKELVERYLPPGNCPLIDAPDLNPEVKAAVSDTVYKRDKGIKIKQRQVTAAISCVAEALTLVLQSKDVNLIKLLMDASKLLCDTQNQDSVTRRSFVLYNLKKELKDQLQETKIDKYLFSQDLADTIKAAKAISKTGADMKIPTPAQPRKGNKPPPKNWRAPPLSHRPKGNQRMKEPARKDPPEYSSKPSSRRAPPPPPPPARGRR